MCRQQPWENPLHYHFYVIKRNIKFNIPILIQLKILESVIEPIALYVCEVWGPYTNQEFIKWDKHQIETLHAEFSKYILCVQRNTPNNACRAESGRYLLIIKIKKRAVKFYIHLLKKEAIHKPSITKPSPTVGKKVKYLLNP